MRETQEGVAALDINGHDGKRQRDYYPDVTEFALLT